MTSITNKVTNHLCNALVYMMASGIGLVFFIVFLATRTQEDLPYYILYGSRPLVRVLVLVFVNFMASVAYVAWVTYTIMRDLATFVDAARADNTLGTTAKRSRHMRG